MTAKTDPTLYDIFERIIREARDADVYDVRLTRTRPDDSTYTYEYELEASQKDEIPWGVLDGIHMVEWHPGGRWQHYRPAEGDKRHVRISYHGYYHGIIVHTGLHEHSDPLDRYMDGEIKCYIIGVAGTIKSLRDCVALPNEDAVVARVLEIIEKAYQVIGDERNAPEDEYAESLADDAYISGPLSELGVFERETGEKTSWVI